MGAFIALAFAVLSVAGGSQAAGSATLVISQIYGGGGNSGAQFTNDYIEIFNRGSTDVPLGGFSLQYTSATGTGLFGGATNLITPLPSTTLQPGQYFLVQEAAGATPSNPLPFGAYTGDDSPINMSATGGKVAIVTGTDGLGCNGGSTACDATQLARIVDLIGYDGANFSETSPAPALTNTTAAFRVANGCTDTDNNSLDFAATAPAPRTAISPFNVCDAGPQPTKPTISVATSPANPARGTLVTFTATTTAGTNPTSTGLTVNCDLSWLGLGGSAALFDDGTNGDATAGDLIFTRQVGIPAATPTGPKVGDCTVSDDQGRSNIDDYSVNVTEPTTPTAIHDIQGAAHISPKNGQSVTNVQGIVTAKRTNGFYMQDPSPDADPATSEGIFVFTSSAPTVNVGDLVGVNANVSEFRPGGASSSNLTTTELVSPSISVLSTGNTLPAPTVVGDGGRIPPSLVIEDDASGDVETSGEFDPQNDGIDFYESLEGMRVQFNNAVAVGPTNSFGETPIVGDDGAHADVRTPRGGLLLRSNDANPERVIADDAIVAMPALNVGDHYSAPIVGPLDYNFGNWFVEVTQPVTRVDGGLQRQVAGDVGSNQLAVATFNFENLDPTDPQSKFDRLASIFVNNLKSPDIVAGEEVQDNNGPTNNGVVDATQTMNQLIAAINAAGGPQYDWRGIDPVNNQDGGEPGGNIRQVFLFRTDRGLSFVDRSGGTSTNATTVTGTGAATQLTFSPGRIDPVNPAWNASRKPLAGEFMFRGEHLFVIANHFNSKGGDQPVYGHFQPPTRSSEVQRHQQAQIVASFVSQLTTADPNANVIVAGDLNDFQFSETLQFLKNVGLHDLIESLPLNQQYSYVFEGNSQVLDHILFSNALFALQFVYEPVHVNAEFADQASDHDPSVVRVTLNQPPTVDANGPYTVAEGGSVGLDATGNDPEGGALTYAWDLDNNGTYETAGKTPTFAAGTLDGPSSRTVGVQVTDNGGLTATDTATVNITNTPPTATLVAPATTFAGFPFTISLTNPSDPSAADTAAGFQYAFDCGSGYGSFGTASTASCPTTDVVTRDVGGKIRDRDGGVTEYQAKVEVVVTFDSLCALTRASASDPTGADDLCAKLDQAAAAPMGTARDGVLSAFRNQVDAKVDKGLTSEQAAELKLLSTRL